MKYVVLARDKETDMIVDSFGVYNKYSNAVNRMSHERSFDTNDSYEYCIEEVDPSGSFANDECED